MLILGDAICPRVLIYRGVLQAAKEEGEVHGRTLSRRDAGSEQVLVMADDGKSEFGFGLLGPHRFGLVANRTHRSGNDDEEYRQAGKKQLRIPHFPHPRD